MLRSTLVSFATGLTVLGTASAQQTSTFVPASLSVIDGPSGGAWPGFTQRFRMQVLLHGNAISGVANRSLIGIAVRRDGQYLAAHAGGRADISISLSHSPLAPSKATDTFALNRGSDVREVFRGQVALPNAPALAHRNDVTWQPPHAVEFPFAAPFLYVGGTLCFDIDGAPVATATARWWRIDYDLFTHDAQASRVGGNCDPRTYATASRETLLPGGSVRLISIGPLQAAGIAMLDPVPLNPGLDLGFLGAPGCFARVNPTLMFSSTYQPPAIGGYGGASVSLQIPPESYFLGATLYSQWLAFPNPVNPAQLTTTNRVDLQVATQLPNLAGVIVRTGVVADSIPMPATGSVLPHMVPVLCLRAQ